MSINGSPDLVNACIVSGIHKSGTISTGPVVRSSATPTIVKGWRFSTMVWPTMSAVPANQCCQALWLSTVTAAEPGCEASSGAKKRPRTGRLPIRDSRFSDTSCARALRASPLRLISTSARPPISAVFAALRM